MQQVIATPSDGARLRVAGDTVRVLASSAHTGGAYEIFELEGPAGSGPPPHAHPWAEAYVVTEGDVEVWMEGVKVEGTRGSFFHIPAGITHTYRITSAMAKFVVITSPGGASECFTELDAQTDMGKIVEVAMKHGFVL